MRGDQVEDTCEVNPPAPEGVGLTVAGQPHSLSWAALLRPHAGLLTYAVAVSWLGGGCVVQDHFSYVLAVDANCGVQRRGSSVLT